MAKQIEKAYAKINLSLDVLRKREDGYHDVKMIMQTVDLYDVLTIETREEPGIVVETDEATLPVDENNLIYKAAKLMFDKCKVEKGVFIHLNKTIPIAAGMAGGSADAAATMRGINALFSMEMDANQLRELAVKIGADVPYCIEGGTVLAEGIGEKLTKISDIMPCYLVIVKPDIAVSTKFVYENLNANTLPHHPDVDGMVEEIRKKNLLGIASQMENVLETVTENKYKVIGELKHSLVKDGALGALMSGSGPTVFGVFACKDKAQLAYDRLKGMGFSQLFITKPIEGTMVS